MLVQEINIKCNWMASVVAPTVCSLLTDNIQSKYGCLLKLTSAFLLREFSGREVNTEPSWDRRARICCKVTGRSSNTAFALPSIYNLWERRGITQWRDESLEEWWQQMVSMPQSVWEWFHYLLAGGQLQHYRGVLSKQRVDCLCDTVQGEGYWLKGWRHPRHYISLDCRLYWEYILTLLLMHAAGPYDSRSPGGKRPHFEARSGYQPLSPPPVR